MRFSDPVHNVRQLNVRANEHVADLGSGSGAYTLALAERVGEKGMVYSVDLNRDLLLRVRNEAKRKGFHHIDVIVGDLEKPHGTKLGSEILDAAVLANVLFFLENAHAAVREIHRILKPGGRLLLVDWKDSYGGIGPSQEHVVPQGEAELLLKESGFRVEKHVEAGAHHYGMIATKYDAV